MTADVTELDQTIGFTLPGRHARGRLVRLGPALDEILAGHAYPPAIERLLAEALTLAFIVGFFGQNFEDLPGFPHWTSSAVLMHVTSVSFRSMR